MVMQGRHAEHPVLSGVLRTVASFTVFEHSGLKNHRHGFSHEHTTHYQEEKLRFQQDGNRSQCSTDSQASGIPHEYFGRVGIEPQESETCPRQGRTKDRELSRIDQIEDVEIRGGVDPADDVREDGD